MTHNIPSCLSALILHSAIYIQVIASHLPLLQHLGLQLAVEVLYLQRPRHGGVVVLVDHMHDGGDHVSLHLQRGIKSK